MIGKTFYHSLLRKYVILFGTMFDNIWINRTTSTGLAKESIKVPIEYGPREKFLARPTVDPELKKSVSIVLPRMGFEITSMSYAAERKLVSTRKFITEDYATDEDLRYSIYNPVPYDIGFSLGIYTKYFDDCLQIIEQILPYFTPDYTPSVQLIEVPNVTLDIPVVYSGISSEDSYEGSFEDRRILIWSIDFVMKCFLFGPVNRTGVIKLANVNFYDSTLFNNIDDSIGNINPITRVTVYPGQTSNGQATTDASEAIDPKEISKDEDWGYVVDIESPLIEE